MPLDPARSHDRDEVSLRGPRTDGMLVQRAVAELIVASAGRFRIGRLARTCERAGLTGNWPTYLAQDIWQLRHGRACGQAVCLCITGWADRWVA